MNSSLPPSKSLYTLVLVVLGCLLPLMLYGVPLTYDGPQHIFAGYLLNHLQERPEWYTYLTLQIPTSAGFVPAVFALLEPYFGWRAAEWCILALIVAMIGAGGAALCNLYSARPKWLVWLVPTLPWGMNFYMGFHNYVAAFGLAILCSCMSIQAARNSGVAWFVAGALYLACAWSHAFAALLCLPFLVVLVLLESAPERRLVHLRSLVLAMIPGAILTAVTAWQGFSDDTPAQLASGASPPLLNSLLQFADTPTGLSAALLLLWAMLVLWVISGARSASLGVWAALTILSYVGVTALLPQDLPQWQTMSLRTAPFIWLVTFWAALFVAQPSETPRRFEKLLHFAFAMLSAASLLNTLALHKEIADIRTEILAGLQAPGQRGEIRRYFRDSQPVHESPVWLAANVHLYYWMEEGGIGDMVFRGRPEAHFLMPTDRWQDGPQFKHIYDEQGHFDALRSTLVNSYLSDDILLLLPSNELLQAFQAAGATVYYSNSLIMRLHPPALQLRLVLANTSTPWLIGVRTAWSPYALRVASASDVCDEASMCAQLGPLPAGELIVSIADPATRSVVFEVPVTLTPTTHPVVIDLSGLAEAAPSE